MRKLGSVETYRRKKDHNCILPPSNAVLLFQRNFPLKDGSNIRFIGVSFHTKF